MHLCAFIAIFGPKLVAMVTPLCPLWTGLSKMNSLMAQSLSQNYFCDFGQNLVAMATSLRPLQSEMSSLKWLITKHPVISNCILVISRRNAFICIYSNICPKIGCHGNVGLSHVYGSVTVEFPDGTNPISKPNSARMCWLKLKLWPYLLFLSYFDQNLVTMATSLRLLQSEMFSLDWLTTKPPVICNRILVVSRRNAFMSIYSNFYAKIGCHGNAPMSLVYGSVTDELPDGTNPISKANFAWMCGLRLKLWPFLRFFGLFGRNLVAMATSLRPWE